jgi:carbonic anhydrase
VIFRKNTMFDLVYRFDPAKAASYQTPHTSEEACRLLVQGNRNFAEMTDARRTAKTRRVLPFDSRAAFGWGVGNGGAPVQSPFAAVLGCADARVPTEMVFSRGCNELFVVRVAGNVLGQECLGSLQYAVSHFPNTLKLLVVLSHAHCGAVTDAVSLYLEPHRYLDIATDYSIRTIEDKLLVAVRIAAMGMEEVYGLDVIRQPLCRAALLEASVSLNAALSAYCLRQEFRAQFPDLGVVFGTYDLVGRRVRLPLSRPGELTEEEQGLFAPPDNVEDFRQLARRICGGRLVQSILNAV